MRTIIAFGIFLLAFSNAARSQEPTLKSPQSQQESSGTSERQQVPQPAPETATPKITPVPVAEPKIGASDTNANKETAQAEQYNWIKKFFYEIKITDVLLVIFTGLLALYTGRLWYATQGLWDAAKEEGRIANEAMIASYKVANAAEQSARVAGGANIIARETSEAQLRAYVHIETVDVLDKIDGDEAPRFRIKFKNYGQTPAHRVNHNCGVTAVFSGKPNLKKTEKFRYSDLGPSQHQFTTLYTSDAIWPMMKFSTGPGRGDFYLIGEITYFDTFQIKERAVEPHYTRYRFKMVESESGKGVLLLADEGNESN